MYVVRQDAYVTECNRFTLAIITLRWVLFQCDIHGRRPFACFCHIWGGMPTIMPSEYWVGLLTLVIGEGENSQSV